MTQRELDRQVARVTGESIRTINRRGFSIVEAEPRFDPEPAIHQPQVVDWDELETQRSRSFVAPRRPLAPVA